MRHSRPILLAVLLLLISSLACRTLLGDPSVELASPEAEVRIEATATPLPTVAEPTPLVTVQGSLRLDGRDLPDLQFDPPGTSPRDPSRPHLSGEARTLDTEHFRVHYTLSGTDAVAANDGNGNGQPEYVEDVARALEYSWYAEIEYFGWNIPPTDGGLGGDDRYDVYLQKIFDEGNAGYVDSDYEAGYFGDNPNTPELESSASSSYMVLDNDYAGYELDPIPGVALLDYIQSTAAHEFAHMIQYGYDAEEPADWLWEATATWIQDEVFNQANDGNEDIASVFKSPDSCQLAYGGEDRIEDSNHWYGEWIFLRFLSERYGHESVRTLWENTISRDGYDVWDRTLSGYGISFEDLFREFSVAMLTRDFEEGRDYPVVRLEGELGASDFFEPVDGVGQVAVDYVEIHADQPIVIYLNGSSLEGLVVGVGKGQASLFALSGGAARVDASAFQHLYLLVLNLQRARNEADCRFTTYSVETEPGTDSQTAASSQAAPNFEAPVVEGLLDPDAFFDN